MTKVCITSARSVAPLAAIRAAIALGAGSSTGLTPSPRTTSSQTSSNVTPKTSGGSQRSQPARARRASQTFSPQPPSQTATAASSAAITALPPFASRDGVKGGEPGPLGGPSPLTPARLATPPWEEAP